MFTRVKEVCLLCEKSVFFTEKILVDGKIYHTGCFKCTHCKCQLNFGNFAQLDNVPYCKTHLIELFKRNGRYDFAKKKDESSDTLSKKAIEKPTEETKVIVKESALVRRSSFVIQKQLCNLCGKSVYANEMIKVDQSLIFHVDCFKCTHCKCKLTLGNYAMNEKPYCKTHMLELFKRKGSYNFEGKVMDSPKKIVEIKEEKVKDHVVLPKQVVQEKEVIVEQVVKVAPVMEVVQQPVIEIVDQIDVLECETTLDVVPEIVEPVVTQIVVEEPVDVSLAQETPEIDAIMEIPSNVWVNVEATDVPALDLSNKDSDVNSDAPKRRQNIISPRQNGNFFFKEIPEVHEQDIHDMQRILDEKSDDVIEPVPSVDEKPEDDDSENETEDLKSETPVAVHVFDDDHDCPTFHDNHVEEPQPAELTRKESRRGLVPESESNVFFSSENNTVVHDIDEDIATVLESIEDEENRPKPRGGKSVDETSLFFGVDDSIKKTTDETDLVVENDVKSGDVDDDVISDPEDESIEKSGQLNLHMLDDDPEDDDDDIMEEEVKEETKLPRTASRRGIVLQVDTNFFFKESQEECLHDIDEDIDIMTKLLRENTPKETSVLSLHHDESVFVPIDNQAENSSIEETKPLGSTPSRRGGKFLQPETTFFFGSENLEENSSIDVDTTPKARGTNNHEEDAPMFFKNEDIEPIIQSDVSVTEESSDQISKPVDVVEEVKIAPEDIIQIESDQPVHVETQTEPLPLSIEKVDSIPENIVKSDSPKPISIPDESLSASALKSKLISWNVHIPAKSLKKKADLLKLYKKHKPQHNVDE